MCTHVYWGVGYGQCEPPNHRGEATHSESILVEFLNPGDLALQLVVEGDVGLFFKSIVQLTLLYYAHFEKLPK